jgi:hypothetical protein
MKAALVAVLAILLSGQLGAQWLKQPTSGIPRTADGKPDLMAPAPRAPDGRPDLSGLWLKVSPKYARNVAADLKPDEIQPWARDVVERRREDLGKDGMQVRCLPLGPAYATSGDSTGSEMTRIVQTPQLIVMLNPDLTYRQIWMDGRALEPEPNPSWMGYSVGRWDGDTLVVDTVGIKETVPGYQNLPHSDRMRITERLRLLTPDVLHDQITIDDPVVLEKPFVYTLAYRRLRDYKMVEFVCDNNREYVDEQGKVRMRLGGR